MGYSLNYPIKYFSFGRSLSGRAIQGFRPHRSSTLQARSSLAMLQSGSDSIASPSLFFHVAGSFLTCNVPERCRHARFFLSVLPRCRFVPHLQCYRAGRTRCFSLSGLSRCRFVPHLQCYRTVRTASFHPRFLPRCRFVPRLQCSRTVRSAAFHPRFLPRCRFVPRLQCYRTASDSLAPLLSLTQ